MTPSLDQLAAWMDAHAAAYDGRSPHEDAATLWRHTATNVVLTMADAEAGDVVLDLGTGTGNVARTLAPHVRRVIGVDCSGGMLARARADAPENTTWVQGDLRRPPRVPGLTLVTSCFALHHLSRAELRALWLTLHAALPEGGRLAMGELFWSVPPRDVEGIRGWAAPAAEPTVSAQTVLEDLEASGFRAVLQVLHPVVAAIAADRL